MTHLEIEAFLNIIQYGSITKAAEKLYISQPALSRRIQTLESELGYQLIVRQKGVRSVELTDAGRAFIPIAERWRTLCQESQKIRHLDRNSILNVASVDSVSTYILPPVFHAFLQSAPKTNLTIRTLHSFDAYPSVENGFTDIAFISDDRYYKNVETIPAFRETMYFVCASGSNYPPQVHPSTLDAKKQIKLPWNPEYNQWHEYWFGSTTHPLVFLDKMSLMEQFICLEDSWAILPASIANQLEHKIRIQVHEMQDGPSDRITYYLLGADRKPEPTNRLLHFLKEHLERIEGISSLLVLNEGF